MELESMKLGSVKLESVRLGSVELDTMMAGARKDKTNPVSSPLHYYAVFVAIWAFILILAGGLVTSTGSGLSVPDWPLSFGTLFPEMKGGVLFEHSHRLIAGGAIILTIILAIWIWTAKESKLVRLLGMLALGMLLIQVLLGGLTVILKLPPLVSVCHAGVAYLFFSILVSIAIITSPTWHTTKKTQTKGHISNFCFSTTFILYCQILLGAVMRHLGAALAIPDFPLSFGSVFPPLQNWSVLVAIHFSHRFGAFLASCMILLAAFKILRVANFLILKKTAFLAVLILLGQLILGGLVIWTKKEILITIFHVGMGTILLATVVSLTVWSFCLSPQITEKNKAKE